MVCVVKSINEYDNFCVFMFINLRDDTLHRLGMCHWLVFNKNTKLMSMF